MKQPMFIHTYVQYEHMYVHTYVYSCVCTYVHMYVYNAFVSSRDHWFTYFLRTHIRSSSVTLSVCGCLCYTGLCKSLLDFILHTYVPTYVHTLLLGFHCIVWSCTVLNGRSGWASSLCTHTHMSGLEEPMGQAQPHHFSYQTSKYIVSWSFIDYYHEW